MKNKIPWLRRLRHWWSYTRHGLGIISNEKHYRNCHRDLPFTSTYAAAHNQAHPPFDIVKHIQSRIKYLTSMRDRCAHQEECIGYNRAIVELNLLLKQLQ